MKILIIEDEIPAQMQLERLIVKYYPTFEIVGRLASVRSAVEWLGWHTPDLIFMDVELSDGLCFEIFKQTTIRVPVIITTAYDNYAVKAFKVNTVDYLLKPIAEEDFTEAVEKCLLRRTAPTAAIDMQSLKQLLQPGFNFKQRFTVKLGDHIIVLNVNDIAYFCAEDKATFIVTHEDKKYLSDLTLDALEEVLDPKSFFRLTRGCIANVRSIDSIVKYSNSRLKVELKPVYNELVLVSRVRIPLFLDWLEGK